jgi:hypothetical protein
LILPQCCAGLGGLWAQDVTYKPQAGPSIVTLSKVRQNYTVPDLRLVTVMRHPGTGHSF